MSHGAVAAGRAAPSCPCRGAGAPVFWAGGRAPRPPQADPALRSVWGLGCLREAADRPEAAAGLCHRPRGWLIRRSDPMGLSRLVPTLRWIATACPLSPKQSLALVENKYGFIDSDRTIELYIFKSLLIPTIDQQHDAAVDSPAAQRPGRPGGLGAVQAQQRGACLPGRRCGCGRRERAAVPLRRRDGERRHGPGPEAARRRGEECGRACCYS